MKQLLFVYNANSGYLHAFIDAMHKTLSPNTYQCDLCALTYSSTGMKREWRQFIRDLPLQTVFLHRDEFYSQYPDAQQSLPAVFLIDKSKLSLIVTANQLNNMSELSQLKTHILHAINR